MSLAGLSMAQGSGPADFGWANHLVIGIWLAFWFAVVIYPAALLVLLIWLLAAPNPDGDAEGATGARKLTTVARWAVVTHLGLTLLVTVIFAFN